MKKFILIILSILVVLFVLLYVILFRDYKTSEKTKKFIVSQYSDKNKTINTFCSDYYEFSKAYSKGKDEYYESMNLRKTGENIWTGQYSKSINNKDEITKEVIYKNEKYYDSKTGKEIRDFKPYFQTSVIKYEELKTTEEVSTGIISDHSPNEGYFRGKYLNKKLFKEFFKDSDWNLEGDLKMDVNYQSIEPFYYQMIIETENEKLRLRENYRYVK